MLRFTTSQLEHTDVHMHAGCGMVVVVKHTHRHKGRDRSAALCQGFGIEGVRGYEIHTTKEDR